MVAPSPRLDVTECDTKKKMSFQEVLEIGMNLESECVGTQLI